MDLERMDLDFLELRASMLELKEMMKLLMLHRGLDPSLVFKEEEDKFKEEEDKEESVAPNDDSDNSGLIAWKDEEEISDSSLKNVSSNLVNQVKMGESPRLRDEEGVVSKPLTESRNPNLSTIQARNADLGEKEQTRLQESNEYLKPLVNLKKTKQATIVSEFDSQFNFLSDQFTIIPTLPRDSYTSNLTNEMKHQLLNPKDCVIDLYSKYEVLRCAHKVFDKSPEPDLVGASYVLSVYNYWDRKPPKPPDYGYISLLSQANAYSSPSKNTINIPWYSNNKNLTSLTLNVLPTPKLLSYMLINSSIQTPYNHTRPPFYDLFGYMLDIEIIHNGSCLTVLLNTIMDKGICHIRTRKRKGIGIYDNHNWSDFKLLVSIDWRVGYLMAIVIEHLHKLIWFVVVMSIQNVKSENHSKISNCHLFQLEYTIVYKTMYSEVAQRVIKVLLCSLIYCYNVYASLWAVRNIIFGQQDRLSRYIGLFEGLWDLIYEDHLMFVAQTCELDLIHPILMYLEEIGRTHFFEKEHKHKENMVSSFMFRGHSFKLVDKLNISCCHLCLFGLTGHEQSLSYGKCQNKFMFLLRDLKPLYVYILSLIRFFHASVLESRLGVHATIQNSVRVVYLKGIQAHQAELMSKNGTNVLKGFVSSVVRQILAEERDLGKFTNGFLDGVYIVKTDRAEKIIGEMTGQTLIIKQLGPKGEVVSKVHSYEKLLIVNGMHFTNTLGHTTDGLRIVSFRHGETKIKYVAEELLDMIMKVLVDVCTGIIDKYATKLAYGSFSYHIYFIYFVMGLEDWQPFFLMAKKSFYQPQNIFSISMYKTMMICLEIARPQFYDLDINCLKIIQGKGNQEFISVIEKEVTGVFNASLSLSFLKTLDYITSDLLDGAIVNVMVLGTNKLDLGGSQKLYGHVNELLLLSCSHQGNLMAYYHKISYVSEVETTQNGAFKFMSLKILMVRIKMTWEEFMVSQKGSSAFYTWQTTILEVKDFLKK